MTAQTRTIEVRKVELMPDEMVVKTAKLHDLIGQTKEMKADIGTLIEVVQGVVSVLGLTDPATGKIKPEYLRKDPVTGKVEENPMPAILKALGSFMSLSTQASIPVLGKRAEREMNEKFAFIDKLLPALEKYAI